MDGTWNSGNLRLWKNARVPFVKFPQKNWVWKIEQLPKSKSGQTAILMIFDMNGKMDLEKLI